MGRWKKHKSPEKLYEHGARSPYVNVYDRTNYRYRKTRIPQVVECSKFVKDGRLVLPENTLYFGPQRRQFGIQERSKWWAPGRKRSTKRYNEWLGEQLKWAQLTWAELFDEVAGRDIACWCEQKRGKGPSETCCAVMLRGVANLYPSPLLGAGAKHRLGALGTQLHYGERKWVRDGSQDGGWDNAAKLCEGR